MSHTSKENPRKMSLPRLVMLVLACAVFLFSGYQIVSYFKENQTGDQLQQELIDQAKEFLRKRHAGQA